MFSFLKKTDKASRSRHQLHKVLGDYSLPSFSRIAIETLHRIRDPRSSSGSIAEVLSMDPGLTVRLLRMANSSMFSPRTRIENLTQAVALVGLSQLESMVLSVAASSVSPRARTSGFDFNRFWGAAARRGVLAREFAGLICPTKANESFLAGFLQDMAIPFLARYRPMDYGPLLQKWHECDEDLAGLERDSFAWDHAEVASWICEAWSIPEGIAAAIAAHHKSNGDSTGCCSAANLVAVLRENENRPGTESLISAASRRHGISEDKARRIVDESFDKSRELARLMI